MLSNQKDMKIYSTTAETYRQIIKNKSSFYDII